MTSNLNPYPQMKHSGVDLLDSVPAHWDVCRLKRICRFKYGDSLANDSRVPGENAVYGSNGVVGHHNKANTWAPCIVIGRKGSFGKVNYSCKAAFAIDTTFFVDARFSSAEMRWLYHLLGWLRLDAITKDSAVPGLDREDAYQRFVPLPMKAEQTAIARFLDHATDRIDRYIRAKEKLIALLDEQKQILVHNAVTGRIDVRTGKPYLAYKPSGVKWLGKVPAHWQVVRNGQLFDQRHEVGFSELPILEVSLVSGVRVRDFENSNRKQIMSDRKMYKRATRGDIAYNMMRMWQGAVGVAPVDGLVSPAYVVAKPRAGTEPRYFDHLFHTGAYMTEVDKYSRGIVKDRNRLYWEDFKRMPAPCPPPDEQVQIADAIDREARFTSTGIRNARRQVSLVIEYRTRLIADVVTGKLDVRDAAEGFPGNADALAREARDPGPVVS